MGAWFGTLFGGYGLGNPLNLGDESKGGPALRMTPDQRSMHFHIVGSTGSGKTKFLEALIRQDILANPASRCGVLVVDPHGSLYHSLMNWLTRHGIERPVTPINLSSNRWITAYNVLRPRKLANDSVVVDALTDAMAHVWGSANTDQTPRMARWAGNVLHVLYEGRYTLPDAVALLSSDAAARGAMTAHVKHDLARTDWAFAQTLKPKEFEEQIGSTLNRLRRFVSNDHMRAIFGQKDVSFDFGEALRDGHIVLVNLSQEGGTISEENARLFGTLLLSDLWTAAKERGKRQDVKPFYIFVDEFQLFLSPTIAANLDQSRGFGIHWTLSHQFPAQLRDAGENGRKVYNSVMENARSKACFSLSTRDNLEPMAEWLFRGVMDPDEIKHTLYTTKVMSYREEERESRSRSVTRSSGGTEHSSESSGEGMGGRDDDDRPSDSWSSYSGRSDGFTESWSQSETEGVSESTVFIPEMGREASSVQFRTPEEQLLRAMSALFDQTQRHCFVRLQGMRAPVSIATPYVEEPRVREERVEEYERMTFNRLPFAIRASDARRNTNDSLSAAGEPRCKERDGRHDFEPHGSRRIVES